MTDIVERLRKWEQVYKVDAHEDGALYNAAADEIDRLRTALSEAAIQLLWCRERMISPHDAHRVCDWADAANSAAEHNPEGKQ